MNRVSRSLPWRLARREWAFIQRHPLGTALALGLYVGVIFSLAILHGLEQYHLVF